MRFVSPVLKRIVFPALSRSGYLRYRVGAGPAIVTYHGVFPKGYKIRNPALDGNLVHADSLRRQLQLLRRCYHVISPDDFCRWMDGEMSLPSRSILLTCDDALRNTLTEMVPILQELGVLCVFFATGSFANESLSMLWYEELYLMLLEASEPIVLHIPDAEIGIDAEPRQDKHACWWNLVEPLSQFGGEQRRRFLDQIRDQLKLSENWAASFVQDSTLASRFLTLDRSGLLQLADAGMSIGAHSLSHPILAHTTEELAWREISESRTLLEKALGQTVWAFAYPFGNGDTVTTREFRLAEQAGFRCAFMNTGGGFGAKLDRFALPRVHVTADMKLAEFEAHISGFYRSLHNRMSGQ
jgi:peptidoglycan/xylan/chitin deacetylase (PgdA/CDA1 family)